jgi:putative phosphoribosyl transferase
MIFDDRQDAGSRLANHLLNYQNHPNTVVLGLSCGGMPVAFEIAQSLGLGIHTLIVRKIRSPQYINLSLGVIAEQNIELLHADLISILDIPNDYIQKEIENQKIHLARQVKSYHVCERLLYQKQIILVDDGMATGSSMQAAIQALKKLQVANIHIAVPIASHSSLAKISKEVQTTCLFSPCFFEKLSDFYQVFDPVNDLEVLHLLNHSSYDLATTT